jgi:23S rRNA (guanosine2251-2'-O)-methyltransferase
MSVNNFFWIGGKHAVLSAINNPKRVVKQIALLNSDNLKFFKNKKNCEIKNESFFRKIFAQTQITHQGFAAEIQKLETVDLKYFFSQNDKKNLTFLILNNIQDNRNIGSIIRTSLAFGVNALIVEKKNYRSKNAQMYKAACGAIEQLPIIEVANLSMTIKFLKEQDVWIYSFESSAKDNINNINFLNRVAFIFGSEDEGINELVKKNSDRLIKIPIQSNLNSLNVSNAVASALTYYRLCK